MTKIERIKVIQAIYGLVQDGIAGPKTKAAIMADLQDAATISADMPATVIPIESINLILQQEGTGPDMDQPGKWPGGDSGITLPYGYDLGYCSKDKFVADWSDTGVSDSIISRLTDVVGFHGTNACVLSHSLKDIVISKESADKVFYNVTIPEEYKAMLAALPGADKLPPRAQGALVSLGYNRGWKIDNSDRRKEMREIRDAVPNGDLASIKASLLSMRRLWPEGSGVYNHRTQEAQEIAACMS